MKREQKTNSKEKRKYEKSTNTDEKKREEKRGGNTPLNRIDENRVEFKIMEEENDAIKNVNMNQHQRPSNKDRSKQCL